MVEDVDQCIKGAPADEPPAQIREEGSIAAKNEGKCLGRDARVQERRSEEDLQQWSAGHSRRPRSKVRVAVRKRIPLFDSNAPSKCSKCSIVAQVLHRLSSWSDVHNLCTSGPNMHKWTQHSAAAKEQGRCGSP